MPRDSNGSLIMMAPNTSLFRVLLAAGLWLITASASAAECTQLTLLEQFDSLAVARIDAKPGGEVHFFGQKTDASHDRLEQQPAYVVAGDRVIVAEPMKPKSCAVFVGPKTTTAGFLSAHMLKLEPDGASLISDLTGRWDNTVGNYGIDITPVDGRSVLMVNGKGIWQGGTDSAGYPVAHVGEFAGRARLHQGGVAEVHQYRCVVRMRRMGNVLAVQDNDKCGGMNVTFTGLYRRVGAMETRDRIQGQ